MGTKGGSEMKVITFTCDGCKEPIKEPFPGQFEYARLTASWGYGSKYDTEQWDYDLCDGCCARIVELLQLPPVAGV